VLANIIKEYQNVLMVREMKHIMTQFCTPFCVKIPLLRSWDFFMPPFLLVCVFLLTKIKGQITKMSYF